MNMFYKACLVALTSFFQHNFKVQASNLRSSTFDDCVISAIAYLQAPGEPLIPELEYGCENSSGLFIPLHLDEAQEQNLKDLAAAGTVKFGFTKVGLQGATFDDAGSLRLPSGKDIDFKSDSIAGNVFNLRGRRDLQAGTGDKHFLLFRVSDIDGLVHQHSSSRNVRQCVRVGKYRVIPGGRSGYDTSPIESAPGVIDIKIDVSLNNTRAVIRDAVFKAAQEALGNYFNLPSASVLTTYTDHVMFSIPYCFQDCSWAAYAGVGSYYQFYRENYYLATRVQVHETGHNLYLAHSGGLDGGSYSDHTCSMGNPLYGDDDGSMCFNGAKTWQLQTNPHPTTVINGWYNSQDFITVNDTSTSPQTFEMIGVGEYYLQGDGSIDNPRKAVVLQVKDPLGNDQYITFNAAKGANLRNDEASDQITIVESKTGTFSYATSQLKGYINQGETFILKRGKAGKARKYLTALSINNGVKPSVACVCIRNPIQTCPYDCAIN